VGADVTVTRGQRNIAWIESFCCIPEGRDVGKPVRLRPWQKKIIVGIYDKPTRRAIISFGRKNAKTTLAGFLLLLHLAGPEARANSQLYSAAQSRDQAALLFGLASKMVRLSPSLSQFLTVRDSAKQLFCPELGTLYRALSADATTAYGLSPVFIVHDELGQVKGSRSPLYEALETATGAQQDPLSIVISTQAPTDADLLSVLIDDAKAGHDKRVRLFIYTAPVEDDPFSAKTIRKANPAFGDFLNAEEVKGMANDAKRMPSREAEYRNLVLNQRVEMSSAFISTSVWKENGGVPSENWSGPVYAGLDLSSTSDLTAFVLIRPNDGLFHVKPVFWLPREGLREKSQKDRVPYDDWARQGFLETTPGRAVEYEFVAEKLRNLFDEHDIRKVGYDRWAMKYLVPWLAKAGFTDEEIERFEPFGQGFKDMSPALRDLEAALLEKRLRHGGHPVLSMCAHNSVVASDPAGNRKLTKEKSRGRIDGMVALAMALGVTPEEPEPEFILPRVARVGVESTWAG
jgi:phage terminase large subunit-like protein